MSSTRLYLYQRVMTSMCINCRPACPGASVPVLRYSREHARSPVNQLCNCVPNNKAISFMCYLISSCAYQYSNHNIICINNQIKHREDSGKSAKKTAHEPGPAYPKAAAGTRSRKNQKS